jgi:hypothetical protein
MFYFIEKTPPAKVLTGNCSNTEKSLHFGEVFSHFALKGFSIMEHSSGT